MPAKKTDTPKTPPKKEPYDKAHNRNIDCQDGYHMYIVTAWQEAAGRRKAIHMRCQFCLMPMDLQEVESMEWRKKEGI